MWQMGFVEVTSFCLSFFQDKHWRSASTCSVSCFRCRLGRVVKSNTAGERVGDVLVVRDGADEGLHLKLVEKVWLKQRNCPLSEWWC